MRGMRSVNRVSSHGAKFAIIRAPKGAADANGMRALGETGTTVAAERADGERVCREGGAERFDSDALGVAARTFKGALP
jgi:hypothetical protein